MKERYVLGIDIGGTFVKIAILTKSGEIVEKWSISTNKKDHGENIMKDISMSFKRKLMEVGFEENQIISAGIGVPGMIDKHQGMVAHALSIGWEYYPATSILSNYLDIPVSAENDANLAVLGEQWCGAGMGSDDLILLTIGTGVGGGMIINGKIVQGTIGSAGEIGHITVETKNGFLCHCGKRGCLETVSSATGMVRLAKEAGRWRKDSLLHDKHPLTAKDIFECARRGDHAAILVIDKAMRYLGIAAANLANVLNPKKILIGGGVSGAGEEMLTPLKRHYEEHVLESVKNSSSLELAALGNDAGVVGAARLAVDTYREKGNYIYEQKDNDARSTNGSWSK